MPFRTNLCKYGQLDLPPTSTELCAGLITALLNAGWTTVSGDLSDMTLQSVPTPDLSLQMQIRVYVNTANYVYFRPIQPFTTSSPDQMRLYSHPAWRYRYSISPYQCIAWKWPHDRQGNERIMAFGCPWFPADMSAFITSCAWVHRTDDGGLLIRGDHFLGEGKINALAAATQWFYLERQNGNSTPVRMGSVGCDEGVTFYDPILVSNLNLGGNRFIGGLWDAAFHRANNVAGIPNYRHSGFSVRYDGRRFELVTHYGAWNSWQLFVVGENDA